MSGNRINKGALPSAGLESISALRYMVDVLDSGSFAQAARRLE
jgi:hypothetical protein